MLRKSVTAIAIVAGLVSFTGQSFAQQAPAKSAVTSSVKRVGAASGQANNQMGVGGGLLGMGTFGTTLFVVGGMVAVGMIAANNNEDASNTPVSGQ